ncbi:MAG: M23 family metallopeptidase [Thermoanaerobacteraceae bacterium]|nr:M23 family metallopeptidase [Thermoanaerobacteraceae bacterium]
MFWKTEVKFLPQKEALVAQRPGERKSSKIREIKRQILGAGVVVVCVLVLMREALSGSVRWVAGIAISLWQQRLKKPFSVAAAGLVWVLSLFKETSSTSKRQLAVLGGKLWQRSKECLAAVGVVLCRARNLFGGVLAGRLQRPPGPNRVWQRELKEHLLVVGAAVGCTALIFYCALGGWLVEAGGEPVGVVKKRVVAEKVVEELLEARETLLGQPVKPEEEVSYRRVRVFQNQFLTAEELRTRLEDRLHLYTEAAVVCVNGKEQFYFKDTRTAQAFLHSVRQMYAVKQDQPASFGEEIQVVVCEVPADRLTSVEDALSAVRRGIEEKWRYIVKEGDNLWNIAAAQGLSVEDVIAANPGINPDRLSIGQVIRLRREKPLLTVIQQYEVAKIEPIPFPREIQYDQQMHRGQVKIVKQGQPGKKEITYRVTVENGVEVNREVIATRELSPPVKQVERRGSRYLLASRGEGRANLGWPISGPILSGYGMRWGRMHTGLDIGAGYGAAVSAAGSGTVIRAGWYSGYGHTVDIDHGDGVVTRYAHLSRIDVGVGEVVGRGQIIGAVGSTGHSYGPHLHFEVIVNGAPRNPLQYL